MKKIYFAYVVVFFGLGLSTSVAQTSKAIEKTDFSGTWILIPEKSRFSNRGRNVLANYTMQISVNGEAVKIHTNYIIDNHRVEEEQILYLDGRGETRQFPVAAANGSFERKSKTKWAKGKIIRTWSEKEFFGWSDGRQEYRLTDDKNELIFELSQKLFGPEPISEQLVFRRER